jgi:putative membrane protein
MLWIKAFHLIAMVAWFAGLFYLPRLFVYHTNIPITDQKQYDLFCTMERRLFWGIMTPSAVITLLLGFDLIHRFGLSLKAPPLWLMLKLGLVAILAMYHAYCGKLVMRFAQRNNVHSSGFYRWFNEIPTVLLIGIVILVVVKIS